MYNVFRKPVPGNDFKKLATAYRRAVALHMRINSRAGIVTDSRAVNRFEIEMVNNRPLIQSYPNLKACYRDLFSHYRAFFKGAKMHYER